MSWPSCSFRGCKQPAGDRCWRHAATHEQAIKVALEKLPEREQARVARFALGLLGKEERARFLRLTNLSVPLEILQSKVRGTAEAWLADQQINRNSGSESFSRIYAIEDCAQQLLILLGDDA